jgi:hypothetical protein
MEHRQPPRMAPTDQPFDNAAQQAGGRFRLRRFDEEGNRRKIDYQRAGVMVVVGLAVAAGLLYLADRAGRAAFGWLADQPQYQIPFDRIELVHEPPRWFEGGTQAFLKGARLASREPDHVSVLDGTRDDLRLAFTKYAWVVEVIRVAYGGGRIRVDLRYRQPVAWVQLRDAGQVMVDQEGIILPSENVDVAKLGRVIPISGGGLTTPSPGEFGKKWKSKANGTGLDQVDERILAAAQLAAFLLREPRLHDAERSSSLRILAINVADYDKVVPGFGKRGLFVFNADDAAIWWGNSPGTEQAGEHSAEEKWAILRRWAETVRARFAEPNDYWSFSRTGLQYRCPHRENPHNPREFSSPGPRNRSDERTKSSASG